MCVLHTYLYIGNIIEWNPLFRKQSGVGDVLSLSLGPSGDVSTYTQTRHIMYACVGRIVVIVVAMYKIQSSGRKPQWRWRRGEFIL